MDTESLFRLFSMTKPIVSVAVLMLNEQGRLLLNDPVEKYLPEFANATVAEGKLSDAVAANRLLATSFRRAIDNTLIRFEIRHDYEPW